MPAIDIHVPAILALCSALLFAVSDQLQARGLEHIDAGSAAVVSIGSATLAFWLMAPWLMSWSAWTSAAAILFALTGIFRPALSQTLALMAIKHMGPTLASAFAATSPLFGAGLAIVILGEVLTPSTAAGTLAIVAGCIVASLRPQGLKRAWPLWAIVLPLGAALIRAGAHVVTKIGFREVPDPYFAAFVAMTVSTGIAFGAARAQGIGIASRTRAYGWFAIGGALNALSLLSLNTALKLGSVVTVAPIVAATPVFTLLLGLIVFRREVITWRTVLTIALIVPGVILVALR
jgi:drug/metabolite transporter (DMT)-like permease